jgi:hypothetical protein
MVMMEITPEKSGSTRRGLPRWVYVLALLGLLVLFFGWIAFPLITNRMIKDTESGTMQASRTIALALFQYANDHDGRYPDGNSSTEVFQKLIDGNYITDPGVFYVPLAGKVKARAGDRLKPENVSFDITGGADANAPDGLPLVFLTGYKVDYRPGGKAVSLTAPYTGYQSVPRTWSEWWHDVPVQPYEPVMCVTYKSNTAFGKRLELVQGGYGYARNFVPADFDAKGKTYRQLTPDGVLKP